MYIFSATQCIHIIVRRQTGRQACMRRLLCLMVDRRAEQERKNQASMSLLLFSCSRQLMAASKVVARVLKMAWESGTISGTIQMKLVRLLLIVLLSFGFVTQRQSVPLQPAQWSNNKWVSTPAEHKSQGIYNTA